MKNLLLSAIFLLTGSSILPGQGLKILYDAQSDSIRYFKDGKLTAKPKVRRGQPVELRILNYNNYLYKATVKLEDSAPKSASVFSGGLNNILPMLGQSGGMLPFDALIKSFGDSNPLLFPFKEFEGLGGLGFTTNQEVERFNTLLSDFTLSVERIEAAEKELLETQEDMQRILEAQRIQNFAYQEVRTIKYNPLLPPREVKRMSMEYMELIFGEKARGELSLSDIIQRSEARKEMEDNLKRYNKKAKDLSLYLQTVGAARQGLGEFGSSIEGLKKLQSEVNTYYTEGSQRVNQYNETAKLIAEELPNVKNLDIDQLSKLRYELEELKANDFSYTYRTNAQGDEMRFNLSLAPVDTTSKLGLSNKELSTVEIPVYGGFKINASIGVSFGSYFNTPEGYFLRDSVIKSEEKDSFFPVLTSFIHFYNQGSGNISLGGTFGLGLSIGGDEGLQSANFLLGPSLILGRGERIVLSGGIMGGKVTRLGQGYQVGDRLISEVDNVPTRSVYQMGYFAGLSFNLISN
ncbi:MAG: hypothetical protein H6573_29745 [Lewinellaceae bacterium]|nr:hypothetical protein [Phaeodactylibacter sp.]MCB9351651.1 hypothetical protein [Lewinellaceae bacterium]